jgi:hypothetical protein
VLDHFDRYVGDLKGFLAYGGLDRQARTDRCNQGTSVHRKLQRLSILPPSPASPCYLTSAIRFLPTAPFHEGVDLFRATKRASDNARLFSIPE